MKICLNPLSRRDHKSVPKGKSRILLKAGESFEVPDQEGYALLSADKDLIDASKLEKPKKRAAPKTKMVAPVDEAPAEKVK